MKKQLNLISLLGLATLLILTACRKTENDPAYNLGSTRPAPQDSVYDPPKVFFDPATIAPGTQPGSPLTQQQASCPSLPIYGDTIIYPQPTNGSDYFVNPVNNPGSGKYLSWPVGMVIDSVSGAIDVTASETGMKYIIGFVASGTTDTCRSYLTIGGAAYTDSVHVLSLGQTTAAPYFEANPTDLNLCQTSNACQFDVTGSAAKMKVIVNKSTGVIDLQKTLNGTGLLGVLGGAFGILPVNGQSVTTDIYYKIGDDPSHNALQKISVQLVYYDNTSLINGGLLGNIVTKLDNLTSGNPISTSSNPRPPLVVIVRHN
ncbi:MAG TPA: hypothetical protein VMH27_08200 [Puia sp.]|nr:hypothetical protein [Puia sp.]